MSSNTVDLSELQSLQQEVQRLQGELRQMHHDLQDQLLTRRNTVLVCRPFIDWFALHLYTNEAPKLFGGDLKYYQSLLAQAYDRTKDVEPVW